MSKKRSPDMLGLINRKDIMKLAELFDTPEMRELYESQKVINSNLDQDCSELAEEIEDIFKHNEVSKDE